MDNVYEVNLRINWIRHGYSCANLLYDTGNAGGLSYIKNLFKGKIGDNRGTLAPDARLTNKAMVNICEYKNVPESESYFDILKSDYYFCSELTRAAETAMLLFRNIKKKPVYVVPYICEKRMESIVGDSDNVPSTIKLFEENIKKLREEYAQDYLKDCNKNNLDLPDVVTSVIREFRGGRGKPTLPSFDDFLSNFMAYHIEELFIGGVKKINLSLSIVSHGHFIKEVTGIKDIGNLDIILQQIHLKYTKNERNEFIILPQNNKLFVPIPIGTYLNMGPVDLKRCTEYNFDKSACRYNVTQYGNIAINSVDAGLDAQRCGQKVINVVAGLGLGPRFAKQGQTGGKKMYGFKKSSDALDP